MTNNSKSKMSFSEEMYSSPVNTQGDKTQMDPGTSYEIFRNNDTAIEVVVKDTSKSQKVTPNNSFIMQKTISFRRLQVDFEKLKDEFDKVTAELLSCRKGFEAVTKELKKQLDTANQREYETQKKNLALQLENEKLQALLDSKVCQFEKLKKELSSMKRVMKFAIKGICNAPQVPENVTFSDTDYEEFENDLRKECRVRFAVSPDTEMDTLDSSVLKNSRAHCLEKRF